MPSLAIFQCPSANVENEVAQLHHVFIEEFLELGANQNVAVYRNGLCCC
jgi:hypothetical protein